MNQDALAVSLSAGSASAILLCYVAGIFSSLTPCIYPLIPVTVSILGSRKASTRLRALSLSLAYVFGIATTYAALGLVAAFTGSLFGSVSANPWVLIGVGVFIAAMSLNMLEALPLPMYFLNGFLGSGARREPSLLANFAYGLTFGLIASPCTAPPLAAILTWVSSTHNLMLGPIYLFSFAFGMGSLLVVLGTFSSFMARLPSSGQWMVNIKKAMGYLMLAMAGYFIFQAGQQW